jgi:NADPH:quinone reductase-like Zn-dependent oxidoreductase
MMTLATSGMGYALRSVVTPGPRVRIMMARPRRADLATLAEYVDQAALRPVVESVHPLEDTGRLHELAAIGHGRGKRVINVLAKP